MGGATLETSPAYKRHRFPARLIAYAVWLDFRFPLSLRLVEELLLERGILAPYEAIRRWAVKFGPAIARGVRRRAPRPGDIWPLDEPRVVIRGEVPWLGRAVDRHGVVLDEIVQRRRGTRAAKGPLVELMKRPGWTPRRIVTDELAANGAAKGEVAPGSERRSHEGLNNRAEDAHLPLRERERRMQRFRSAGTSQRSTAVSSAVRDLFVPPASERPALSPTATGSPLSRAGAAPPALVSRPERNADQAPCKPAPST
jgi:putative transposase